ncbi:nuclease-related domain-containing protein [Piscibacillus sp. B03]|uniref:nuclease-related domain-containing protein n=1 Tax=Piscibacillus sp. B03 TaxID=3457430 RepID=UPI003FCC60AA
MILKELHLPPYLLQLEAFIRRLTSHFENYTMVQDQLSREYAGYYRESQLRYQLSKMNFQHDIIFQIRLPFNGYYFQIDCLLLTPRFFLIIEAKNYRDQVEFNEFNQVLHKDKIYQDPVLQAEEQKYQLQMWLEMIGASSISVETLVTMTNSQALLKSSVSKYQDKVITLPKLSSKIRELSELYKTPVMSISDMKWVGSQMVANHQNYIADVFKRFRVNESVLQRGIVCPKCGVLGTKIFQLRFECPNCQLRSSDAYMTALKDSFLLGKKEITNREFRQFTGIQSHSTTRDLLARSGLKQLGQRRGTRYQLDFDYKRDFDYLKRKNKNSKTRS